GPGSMPLVSLDSVRQLCSLSTRSSTNDCASASAMSTSSSSSRAAASCQSSSRYTSCTTCSLNGNAVPRSCASVVLATTHPLFRSPTSWSSGTYTSSRNTSLNSASPVSCTSGRTSMPGDCMSTTRYEMPLCFGTSGSVRARQIPHRANCAYDVHTF